MPQSACRLDQFEKLLGQRNPFANQLELNVPIVDATETARLIEVFLPPILQLLGNGELQPARQTIHGVRKCVVPMLIVGMSQGFDEIVVDVCIGLSIEQACEVV
jgi:hypothetical protein